MGPVILLLLLACDADGDGVSALDDCHDGEARLSPDAVEVCDGIDNDCDGQVDVEALDALPVWMDADADGHGDPDAYLGRACAADVGQSTTNDDCNDGEPLAWTGAPDTCADGIDNDCDGLPDPDCDASDGGALTQAAFEVQGYGYLERLGKRFTTGDADGDGIAEIVAATDRGYGYVAVIQVRSGVAVYEPAWGAIAAEYSDQSLGSSLLVGEVDGEPGLDLWTGGTGSDTAYLFLDVRPGSQGPLGAAATITSGDGDESFGAALAGVGDQVAVGAPFADVRGEPRGQVELYTMDLRGSVSRASASRVLQGPATGSRFGALLQNVGDLDGDGLDELAVGWEEDAGFVSVFGGDGGAVEEVADALVQFAGPGDFGAGFAGVGDRDGDGLPEIAVGAAGEAQGQGAVRVYPGSMRGTVMSTDAWATLVGPTAASHAGAYVELGVDADGDGLGELCVGSSSSSEASVAWVVTRLDPGTASLDDAGAAVRRSTDLGADDARALVTDDVTGDGLPDLLVGQPELLEESGRIFGISGAPTL